MAATTAAPQRRPTQAAAPKAAKPGAAGVSPAKTAPRSELSQHIGRVVPKGRAQGAPVPKAPAHKPVSAAPVTVGKTGLDTVKAEVKAAGARQKVHDPAAHAASESQRAADVTPEQAQGLGRAQQLDTMAAQKKGPFDRETFKAKLREKINQLKADDAKNIKDGDKGAQLNADVKGTVAEGQKGAAGAIDAAAKQPPPAGDPKKGQALPKASPGELPKVDGGKATPPPVPDAKLSMAAEANAIDRQMAGAKVTPKQLEKANEPTFKAAATARSKATTSAAALPGNARAKERAVHANAKAGLTATTTTGLAGMHGKRGTQLSAALAKQVDGKAKQEAARKRISAELTQIYTATKTSVDERLKKLDDDVAKTFDDGASSAKWDFYEFLGLKLLVYYAAGGWLADLITGDSSKEKIFDEGRAAYMKAMDRVIDQVADVVEKGLNDVVAIIADGKKKLDGAVAKMDPSDREVARELAGDIQGQFADLEKSVEDKQNEIIDNVAKKYVAAQKEVESTVNALRNPVGALIDMAVDAVAGIIETILKMKELLLSALAKAREAIDLIIDDPIGFLRNLVAGVKLGINNFVDNIGTHLKKGLLEWLFGALAGAGIQMPDKFDLSGLLSIVLQVLGLTWTNIRKRAVAIVGEPVVKALETASDIIKVLVTKGASGLWEYVKEQAATMLDTLKESIKTMVIENVIKAGVKWLIGLLNPASAFVKACMAIVDIVSFIIDRGQQILEFVNAVLDSVLAIAKGQIGVAAKAVEWALAKAVPVAIGFLASLLGLGDLSKDIKKVIDKIQAPVNKVIDWLINKAVALVKAVGKLLGFGKKDEDERDTEGARAVKAKVKADLTGREFKDHAQAHNALTTLLGRYKSEGLKGLRLVPSKTSAEPPVVLVSASVAEKVTLAKTTPQEIFQIALDMQYDTRATAIFVTYDGGKKFGGKIGNKEGHAERTLEKRAPALLEQIEMDRAKKPLASRDEPVPVLIEMNRIPCNGCIDYRVLPAFKAASRGPAPKIRLTIAAPSVWTSGGVQMTDPEHVLKLINAGIEVKPLDIWTCIQDEVRRRGIEEIYFRGHVWDVKTWMALNAGTQGGEVVNVEKLVAKANKLRVGALKQDQVGNVK